MAEFDWNNVATGASSIGSAIFGYLGEKENTKQAQAMANGMSNSASIYTSTNGGVNLSGVSYGNFSIPQQQPQVIIPAPTSSKTNTASLLGGNTTVIVGLLAVVGVVLFLVNRKKK